MREETEGRRAGAREEDRRTTGRKEQKGGGGGGGGLREEELVRKMEDCGLGARIPSSELGAVRRLEVRGGRALFTPQVSPQFQSFCFTKSGPVE